MGAQKEITERSVAWRGSSDPEAVPTERLPNGLGFPYVLERKLGRGGMATVYLAHDLKHDRRVAVKVLNAELTARVGAQRFVQEIRLTARLQHPHVLALLDSGVFGAEAAWLAGRPYYVMPYVDGESLRARLDACGLLPVADALRILRDVADGLGYAHAQGVVHRDIKPENILLSGEHAVIADFGIAKALFASQTEEVPNGPGTAGNRPTQTDFSSLVGTRAYMAPEQAAAGGMVDQRVDLYAWGVVAYELLAGCHPFGDSVAAGKKRYSLGSIGRDVPTPLVELAARCLEKDPIRRPQRASELLDVLEEVGATLLTRHRRRAPRWSIPAGATLVAALLLGTVALTWRARAARAGDATGPPLVAVLPFESEGSAPDTMFANGLGDAIAGKLARLGGLRIIDRKSVQSVPQAIGHPQETGKLLGAAYVLRGVLQWSRDNAGKPRVQVSPSLVRVSDGTTPWAGEPEVVSPADPFAVQATIATRVAEALDIALGSADKARLVRAATRDTAAYAAVERGLRIWGRSTDRPALAMEQALREFERAYRLDPRYADAFGAAADLLLSMAQTVGMPALYDSAAVLARHAVAIDPAQRAAVNVLATVELAHDRPLAALQVMERAVRENPSSAELLALLGHTRQLFGDSAAAWNAVTQALRLAPRSELILTNAFDVALALRRYDDARILLERHRSLNAGDLGTIRASAWLAAALGDRASVARALREFRAHGGVVRAGPLLYLMRHADESLMSELATASPDTYGAVSPSDSLAFFTEKAKLFMTRRDGARVRALVDSAYAIVVRLVASPASAPEWIRHRARELAWLAAARGDRPTALAALQRGATSPRVTQQPGSTIDAEQTCTSAEVYAQLGNRDPMLVALRRCLTMPNGGDVSELAEPVFLPYRTEPQFRGLGARPAHD